jgi:acyl carrier protein
MMNLVELQALLVAKVGLPMAADAAASTNLLDIGLDSLTAVELALVLENDMKLVVDEEAISDCETLDAVLTLINKAYSDHATTAPR